MSSKQRTTAVICAALCIAMFLLAPTGSPTEYGRLGYYKYEFLWDIRGSRTIDYSRLMIQFGIVLGIGYFLGWRDAPRP